MVHRDSFGTDWVFFRRSWKPFLCVHQELSFTLTFCSISKNDFTRVGYSILVQLPVYLEVFSTISEAISQFLGSHIQMAKIFNPLFGILSNSLWEFPAKLSLKPFISVKSISFEWFSFVEKTAKFCKLFFGQTESFLHRALCYKDLSCVKKSVYEMV